MQANPRRRRPARATTLLQILAAALTVTAVGGCALGRTLSHSQSPVDPSSTPRRPAAAPARGVQNRGVQNRGVQNRGVQNRGIQNRGIQNRGVENFEAMTGYECPQSHAATFTEAGRYTDGINGFLHIPTGGWAGLGCNGSYDAMPMSGTATQPDPENYALWTFHTSPVTTGTCQINVYVPNDPSIVHVGGHPARYQVYDSAAPSGTAAGSFTIDEPANRGQWASAGTYRVTQGVLTIELTSAGQDWHGTVVTHAHLPITQVVAFCSTSRG